MSIVHNSNANNMILCCIKPYNANNTRNFRKLFDDALIKTTNSHIIVAHNVLKYQILLHRLNRFEVFCLKLLKKIFMRKSVKKSKSAFSKRYIDDIFGSNPFQNFQKRVLIGFIESEIYNKEKNYVVEGF